MELENDKLQFIVFSGEHYNPLGIIRSLGEAGYQPVAIIIKNKIKIASQSKYISQLHFVDTIEQGYLLLLEKYGDCKDAHSVLLTADDKITSFCDMHYDVLKDKFILYNAGENGRVTHFMDKNEINQLAMKCGLNVLETHVVERGIIPEDIVYPIITKSISPNIGGWKKDVFICNSDKELQDAYEKIKSPIVLLQKYIKKKNELCLDGMCVDKGRQAFISIASNYNYLLPNTYSSYLRIFNFNNPLLEKALTEMLTTIGFDGIFSVEFLVGEDGELYFLEINFRNSTWSYASTCAGMNLPVLWAKSMLTGKIPSDCWRKIPDNFNAMVEFTDFKDRVLTKKIKFSTWISEMKGCSCLFYFNRKDMLPFWKTIFSRL